jgi:hypothetical protein
MSDFITRFRVTSVRHSLSVSGEVTASSFKAADPNDLVRAVTRQGHSVTFVGLRDGGLPSFIADVSDNGDDAETALREVAATLEDAYDNAAGEELVR